jgi:hypothetical protein
MAAIYVLCNSVIAISIVRMASIIMLLLEHHTGKVVPVLN